MAGLHKLPTFHKNGLLNVIIETPKGSRNKYTYDSELGLFRLKKVLPLGAVFPFDFGFVPLTLGEDGDPLDILVLMDQPAFGGCLVRSRLIGALEAEQSAKGRKVRNDRLIAIAEKTHLYCEVKSLVHLNKVVLDQIEHFFISYNEAEGKRFRVLRRSGSAEALRLVKAAMVP
jgi:inorganic pyrophosphatase